MRTCEYYTCVKNEGDQGWTVAIIVHGRYRLVKIGFSKASWEEVYCDGCELVIVLLYKDDGYPCENYREISFLGVASKLLTAIVIRRLSSARERCVYEDEAGLRLDRGCIDRIFILRQTRLLHIFRKPTNSVFLDFKAAFDPVDIVVRRHCLLLKGVQEQFISPI